MSNSNHATNLELQAKEDNDLDNRRKVKGKLVRPRQQFKYAMILVCGGILAQSIVIGVVAYFLNNSLATISELHNLDPQIATSIANSISASLVLVLLVATGVALGSVLIGVRLSHRVYGPMIPFRRHIEQLKAGNYTARIRLRKSDDLIELRDALNDLAITLEDQHKSHKS